MSTNGLTKTTKNVNIQYLRGLAIIAVVIIHSNMPDGLRVAIRPFVNYAVALFIFLSGYLTKLNIDNIKEFYKRRIIKVIVPYVIWSIIFYVLISGKKSFSDFAVKLLTGRCCGIYYYIFVYVQFVLLTPLISKLIKSKYSFMGWLITPITIFLFRYLIYIGIPIPQIRLSYTCSAWFIYYYLGLYLGNGIIKPRKKLRQYILLYSVSIILSLAEGYVWYKMSNIDMATTQLRFTSILTSVLFLFCCCFYIKNSNRKSYIFTNILKIIGDCSFGIYLSHILVQASLQKIIPQLMFFPLNTLIVLTTTTVSVFAGKLLLKKYSWILGL